MSLIHDLATVGTKTASNDPNTLTAYDVIVVGGGTSGCVVAARLSENPKLKVLLLEAGQSGYANMLTRIPLTHGLLFRTKEDYDFHTVPQASAANREWSWPRAKMLGGCSAMNALICQFAAPSDYDEWTHGGAEGYEDWNWKSFRKYFRKMEKFNPARDGKPVIDVSQHGTDGPLDIGYNHIIGAVQHAFLDACETVGIPRNNDFNDGRNALGAGPFMTYIDSKGQRSSAETAYIIKSGALKRPNLHVAVGATVTRILFDKTGAEPKAIGVEFAADGNGPRFRAHARHEVVISAGAVHTPHLLMLSGIGPKAQLAKHGIEVVHDLPGVGAGLMDHVVVQTRFRAIPKFSFQYLQMKPGTLKSMGQSGAALMTYLATGKGPFTSNNASVAAFVRSDNTKLFPPSEYRALPDDTTSGAGAPDIEIYACPLAWKNQRLDPVPKGYLVSIGTLHLRPKSTGFISLASANPFDKPIIDPRVLSEKHDVDVLVRGLKLSSSIAQAKPYAACLKPDEDPELDHAILEKSDAELEHLVRERGETLYHPTSTARMAPLEDAGVVDGRLKVHGIHGLRVADAAIFPRITSAHPSATCFAVGEKAADLILEDIGSKRA